MRKTLKVGAAFPDPPFNGVTGVNGVNGAENDGGLDISLMGLVAADLGMTVEFVVSGAVDLLTRDGEQFRLDPRTVLLAEDTSGHRWSIIGDDAWRRVYVQLAADAEVAFAGDPG